VGLWFRRCESALSDLGSGRGRGYIPTLKGSLGWGQDPDREKTRDGFGFYGGRYNNTPFDGQLRPFVDPELRGRPGRSSALGRGRPQSSGIPPSRRGGPNEGYLSQVDGRYRYFEDEGFWDSNGDYHFVRELGYFADDGEFYIYNIRAERFRLGYFDDDDTFHFYLEEIDRIDLNRLVQNIQATGREDLEQLPEERNARAGANNTEHEEENANAERTRDEDEYGNAGEDTTEHEDENPSADRTRDEDENGRADTTRNEEEINPRAEYTDGGEMPGGPENNDGVECSDEGDEVESSDEWDEEEVQMPCPFPEIFETPGLVALTECESHGQFDVEEEEEEQDCTAPGSNNAGALHSPESDRSPPPDQIRVLSNNLDSVSPKANTTLPKHSTDSRVFTTYVRINDSSPTMADPDRQAPKHSTPEELNNTNKISEPAASSGRSARPTLSSSLKSSGSSSDQFGNLRSLGAIPPVTPERCTGKPGINRRISFSYVRSVGESSQSQELLPARYRAQKTADPFVDEVVAQEMADLAREEREEAEAKKKGTGKPRHLEF